MHWLMAVTMRADTVYVSSSASSCALTHIPCLLIPRLAIHPNHCIGASALFTTTDPLISHAAYITAPPPIHPSIQPSFHSIHYIHPCILPFPPFRGCVQVRSNLGFPSDWPLSAEVIAERARKRVRSAVHWW